MAVPTASMSIAPCRSASLVWFSVLLLLPSACKGHDICARQDATGVPGVHSCCPIGGPWPPGTVTEPNDPKGGAVVWDGKECRRLYTRCGCHGCIGDDCDKLYDTVTECERVHRSCR
jgi:hypothetical protein